MEEARKSPGAANLYRLTIYRANRPSSSRHRMTGCCPNSLTLKTELRQRGVWRHDNGFSPFHCRFRIAIHQRGDHERNISGRTTGDKPSALVVVNDEPRTIIHLAYRETRSAVAAHLIAYIH